MEISDYSTPEERAHPDRLLDRHGQSEGQIDAHHDVDFLTVDAAPAGELMVSAEAIDYFHRQLQVLTPGSVRRAAPRVGSGFPIVELKPGTFGKATLLRREVVSGGAPMPSDCHRSTGSRALLEHVYETLYDLRANLDGLIRECDTARPIQKEIPSQVAALRHPGSE